MHALEQTKAIVIFCTSLEIGGEPISDTYYWEAYQDLLLSLKDRGVEAYFATDNATYKGKGRFSVAYTTDTKVSGPSELRAVKDVVASVVLERAESRPFTGQDVTVINPNSLRRIANNKIAIYRNFPSFQPRSIIVNSADELLEAMTKLEGELIVVKDQEGYGGDGVYIGPKAQVFERVQRNPYPMLAQEFLDTSMGPPGHEAGVHDVRLEVCGGKITGCFLRIAKPGSLHSNVNRGGHMIHLPIGEVPVDLARAVGEIDKVFAPAPRFYSADFAYSNRGWRLIELNDYVGLSRNVDSAEAAKALHRLADYLADCCVAAADQKKFEPAPTYPVAALA